MYDQLIWLLIFCTLILPVSYLSLTQRRGSGGGEEVKRRGEDAGGQQEVSLMQMVNIHFLCLTVNIIKK